MKAIITGGAGFIGSNLAAELLAQGWEVHVVDNLATGKRENVPSGAIFVNVDIRKYEDLMFGFELVKPDVVFHLAARPRVKYSLDFPLETASVNVDGTLNVLEAARQAGVKRVVYSSSSSVYGDQESLPLTESMSPKPMSPYGAQKLIGEIYCRAYSAAYGLETVCLRYFNVYGPKMLLDGAYSTVIGIFLSQRAAGKPFTITGDGTNRRAYTNVSDVVRANIMAAGSKNVGKGEPINIGSTKNWSTNEIADFIGGIGSPREYIPARLEPKETKAGIGQAMRLFGWRPVIGFEEGLKALTEAIKS